MKSFSGFYFPTKNIGSVEGCCHLTVTDQIGGQLLYIWQFIWTNIVQSRQVFNFNCKTLNHKINICSGPVYLVREGQTGQKMNHRKLKFCWKFSQWLRNYIWLSVAWWWWGRGMCDSVAQVAVSCHSWIIFSVPSRHLTRAGWLAPGLPQPASLSQHCLLSSLSSLGRMFAACIILPAD